DLHGIRPTYPAVHSKPKTNPMKSQNLLTVAAALGVSALSVLEVSAQTTPAPQPTICSRSCWSARAAKSTPSQMASLTRAIIHHTAGPSDYTTDYETGKAKVRGVQNYHMDNNGWSDIGYHFLVNAGGHIYEGRVGSISSNPQGAHDGVNSNSMGFTALGYFHPDYNHSYTTAMQNALYNTIAWKMPSGWSPYGSSTYNSKTVGVLDGHRSVKATACPGDGIWAHIGTNYNGGNARNGVATRRTPSTEVIVDNNTSGFTASASWSTGTSATDKYGADYRFRSTEAISDSATWTANLSSTKTYTVSAWWSQGSNRSASAPYIVYHAGGSTTVNVNQQANGGKWNTLGSWNMNSGSNQVKLSCWTTTGFVVMADAIRWQ
ncbi:MAG: N-acetylmuramoyl-L-alanine amidase, partial [Limisphaerales bacterium]